MMEYLTPRAGDNQMTDYTNQYPTMMLDSRLVRLSAGETRSYFSDDEEVLIVLQSGKVKLTQEETVYEGFRTNVFDQGPTALHVCCGTHVSIMAEDDSEYLLIMTKNTQKFEPNLYTEATVPTVMRGQGVWQDGASRLVRTIVDYKRNPLSHIAYGETVNYPSKWSGYLPHHHIQPELYYYRFNRPEGFGACFYGDQVYQVKDYAFCPIVDDVMHPQVSAPGYAMYYFWAIRHFDDNPWTSPVEVEEHKWLAAADVKIWPEV